MTQVWHPPSSDSWRRAFLQLRKTTAVNYRFGLLNLEGGGSYILSQPEKVCEEIGTNVTSRKTGVIRH